jgi:glycosyltransferase involved in cell wall biosynthesis
MSSAPESLPPISVALSAFNGQSFLDQQLETLAQQSVAPAELVVCDDCSSDDTPRILDAFSRVAPFPVRRVRNERNLGFNESFIRIADECQSGLVAFCDQDDVWMPQKIEICSRFFAQHPQVRLVMHAGQPVTADLHPVGRPYPLVEETKVVPPLAANPWHLAPGFSLVVDKTLLALADWSSRPPSRDLDGHAMDFDEWLYLLAWAVAPIGFISDRLVQYRQHDDNLFGAPDPGWMARLRVLLATDFATHAGRAAAARAYAELFEKAAADNDQLHNRLAAAASYWRAYKELSVRRDAVYEARSLRIRVRSLSRLIAERAYQSRERGGLGRSALIRDLREVMLPGRNAVDSSA